MGVRYFGARVDRREDEALLTGKGQYVDDITLPGMLHGAFLRSPHAHAKIANIDTRAARAVDGVEAIFTYADLGAPVNQTAIQPYPSPAIKQDLRPYPLARDEVSFVGEPIALVVAESRSVAEDAAALIEVDYETLPAMVDARDALGADAAPVHVGTENNTAAQLKAAYGDIEAAFADADHVLTARFTQHRGGCHAMEGRGVVCRYDPLDDEFTIWSATQCPYLVRRCLARQMAVSESRIRVIAPDVGGGFGPKAGFYVEEILVPFAAEKLGRPVKWIEDRREHFLTTNTQRDSHWELDIAASKDGRITGLKGHVILDCGAYITYGLLLAVTTIVPMPGPYKVPAMEVIEDVVFTNTTSNSPVRGAGRPNAAYAMERVIETIARALDMDSAEVRRRNFVQPEDFPYQTGLIHFNGKPITYDSGDYQALLEKAVDLADYKSFAKRQAQLRKQGRYLGIGISSCIEDTGVGPYEGATVRIDPQGKVHVLSGAASQGQGHKTVIAQIVADELDVVIEDVYVDIGDTAKFPQGVGTVASRVGVNVGTASCVAARDVRSKALELAAQKLDTEPGQLEIADGVIRAKGDRNVNISYGELALSLAPMTGGAIPDGFTPSLEATSYETSKIPPHASGTNICEVEVDIGTGEVKVVRYSVAHDCGRKINPTIVEGQIIGGVVHGIGNALFEQMIYDPGGQPLSTNYGEYLLPLATEMPRIDIAHQETPSPFNPLGLKGAGEGGTIPAAAAVVAAIENALEPFDVVIDYYPVTPEKLCQLIDRGTEQTR
jgi:carbon-monoxide dehydrogenase large subunit